MKSKELTVYLILTAIVLLLMLTFSIKACSNGDHAEKAQAETVTPETVVEAVRQHSRLYTAEATSRKTMTYTSQNKLSLRALGIDKTLDLPLGKTEARIPVTVTYKAYIDLGRVDGRNVRADGETIRISAGQAHYCPKGHSHSLRNDGDEDLVFFAIIPEV